MRSFLFFLFLSAYLLSDEPTITEYFEGAAYSVHHGVNVLHGSLCEGWKDFTVNAVEPITVNRGYCSGDTRNYEGGWKLFPQERLQLCFTAEVRKKEIIIRNLTVRVTDDQGVGVIFKWEGKWKGKGWVDLWPQINDNSTAMTNCTSGEISGRSNPRNFHARYNDKERMVVLDLPDGGERIYQRCTYDKTAPLKFRLIQERRPNGNLVKFTYDKYDRMSSLITLNPSGTKTYASLIFRYALSNEKHPGCTITLSDGRKATYHYQNGPKFLKELGEFFYLSEVNVSGVPVQTYTYTAGEKAREKKETRFSPRGPQIKTVSVGGVLQMEAQFYTRDTNWLPDNSFVHLPNNSSFPFEKTKAIYNNVGKNTLSPFQIFKHFEDHHTEAYDCSSDQTLLSKLSFHYSPSLRMQRIDYFSFERGQPETFQGSQYFFWGGGGSPIQLACRTFVDRDFRGYGRFFIYDGKGNVVTEVFHGNLSGCWDKSIQLGRDGWPQDPSTEVYSKHYQYSNDRFNLLTEEEEDSGLKTLYTYVPGTNLPSGRFVFDRGLLIARYFYDYNEDLVCIQEIEDDGSTFNKEDLTSVQVRKIKRISLKKDSPALNFPEVIVESFWDPKTRTEKLLKKKVLSYSQRAEVIREDIYGSDDTLAYSLFTDYDEAGRVIRKTNPLGQETIYAYDAFGNRIYEKEANSGIEIRKIYENNHLISQEEISPSGKKTSYYAYDFKGRKSSFVDFQGHKTTYMYDAFDHCIEERLCEVADGEGNLYTPVLKRRYDVFGNPIEIATPDGEVTTYAFTAHKKPYRITNSRSTVLHTYTMNGWLLSTTLEDGSKTCYEYNSLGKMTAKRILSPKGKVVSEELWEYKGERLLSYKDSNGLHNIFFYDGAGRKIQERCGKKILSFTYDALNQLYETTISSEDNLAPKVHFTIKDFLGRTIENREEDLSGKILSYHRYEYDAEGNCHLVFQKIPQNEIFDQFFYDSFHRLVLHIDPTRRETHIDYNDQFLNEWGHQVTQKTTCDPCGYFTIETFDELGRLSIKEKTNTFKRVVSREQFFYNGRGKQTKQISSVFVGDCLKQKIETSWVYSRDGKLLQLTEAVGLPEQKITRYHYDFKGRQEAVIKPDGRTLFYRYDTLDHVVELTCSDNSLHYIYTYDDQGNCISIYDQILQQDTKRSYNVWGNVTQETLSHGQTLFRSYDTLGRCLTLTLPDHSSLSYTYDCDHLLQATRIMADGTTYSHHYTYDLRYLAEEELIESLGKVSYSFDLLQRNNRISSPYEEHRIDTFDPIGRVTEAYSSLSGSSSFIYDPLSQLIEESGAFSHHYGYDSHFCRLEKDDTSSEFNALHQLLTSGETHYTYDLNGNPLTKGDSRRFSYDALDRLISIVEEEKFALYFTYDGYHRRTEKKTLAYQEDHWEETSSLQFLYVGNCEIGALDSAGDLVEFRSLGLGKEEEVGATIALELQGEVFGTLHDIRGNLSALISLETGQVVESYRYDGFGQERIYDGEGNIIPISAYHNPWHFSSKRLDSESQLLYFGRRYYDPSEGRWLTPDPAGFIDGPNLYTYAMNTPLNRLDPMGLSCAALFPFQVVGNIIEWVAENLFPAIPFLQTGLRTLGRLIAFNFEPIEQEWVGRPLQLDPSQNLENTGEGPPQSSTKEHCKETIVVLGVDTNKKDCEKAVHSEEKMEGGNGKVVGFNDPTHGWFTDLLECFLLLCGRQTPNSHAFCSFLKNEVSKLDANEYITIIAHSKGALVTERALEKMSPEERSKIVVYAVGGATIIPAKMAKEAHNFFSKRDPMILVNAFGLIKNAIFGGSNVTFVPSKGAIPFTDHAFKRYQPVVVREIQKRSLGESQHDFN